MSKSVEIPEYSDLEILPMGNTKTTNMRNRVSSEPPDSPSWRERKFRFLLGTQGKEKIIGTKGREGIAMK